MIIIKKLIMRFNALKLLVVNIGASFGRIIKMKIVIIYTDGKSYNVNYGSFAFTCSVYCIF